VLSIPQGIKYPDPPDREPSDANNQNHPYRRTGQKLPSAPEKRETKKTPVRQMEKHPIRTPITRAYTTAALAARIASPPSPAAPPPCLVASPAILVALWLVTAMAHLAAAPPPLAANFSTICSSAIGSRSNGDWKLQQQWKGTYSYGTQRLQLRC
jgi:hypothetical protein